MLLITYNQGGTVRQAVRSALAQTYRPLEIVISDDCSEDNTYNEILDEVLAYSGPHCVITNRNTRNLGISAHLGSLWDRVSGELVVIAAGDDESLPGRCARLVQCWQSEDCRPDLIASDLLDVDVRGTVRGSISVEDLSKYRSLEDWLRCEPRRFFGAAHAWSRRLMKQFPPLPPGTWEDHLMMFRAVLCGGAVTLHEPLVKYRRGGQSRLGRAMSAKAVRSRLSSNSERSLVELAQMFEDAASCGFGERVKTYYAPKLAREQFIREMLRARRVRDKARIFVSRREHVKKSLRLRILVYAACPWVLKPLFVCKRLLA